MEVYSRAIIAAASMTSPEFSSPEPVDIWNEVLTEFRSRPQKVKEDVKPERGQITISTEDNTTMGVLYYQLNRYDNHMLITFYGVPPAFQRMGVSRALIARALIEHPTVRKITATLGGANYLPFLELLKSGVSPYEVLKMTPFYKTLEELGFNTIERNDSDASRGHFTMKRTIQP